MLSPKIQSTHILPIRCSHEACRNMDVNSGSAEGSGTCAAAKPSPASTRIGSTPNWKTKALHVAGLSETSNKNTSVFRAISRQLMNGVDKLGWSRPSGIIRDEAVRV